MTAAKKKSDQTQMVVVDARKLGQGLKTTFEGVAMVFDSIGMDAGLDDLKKSLAGESKEKLEDETLPQLSEKEVLPDGSEESATTEPDATEAESDEASEKSVPLESDTPEEVKAPESKTQHKVTQDDITRIIVQKIRVDRSKNETIGQILKTYGVSKVSELPSEKYEAFLTDLAAI